MITIRQIAGHAIQRATAGRRNVSEETREKFTTAVADLRAELGEDAVLEFCLGEIVRQMNASTEEQEDTDRAQRRRFSDYLTNGDEPARSPSMAQYLD